jgi:RNA polymerase sigma-70 factor (ECF subfamily)
VTRADELPESDVAQDEGRLVVAIRQGAEAAFATLVDRYSPLMLRVACFHVDSRDVAEEVVQEAWLSVLRSIDRFEGRSSLKTWLLVIVTNAARKRAARERRSVPFSSLNTPGHSEPELDAERFFGADHPRWADCWSTIVRSWDEVPEEHLLGQEAVSTVQAAASSLPAPQRTVFMLRDVDGLSAVEVCNTLGLSDSNQRVLLHRARVRVRHALERYFDQEGRRA